jgi:hypothetical protein
MATTRAELLADLGTMELYAQSTFEYKGPTGTSTGTSTTVQWNSLPITASPLLIPTAESYAVFTLSSDALATLVRPGRFFVQLRQLQCGGAPCTTNTPTFRLRNTVSATGAFLVGDRELVLSLDPSDPQATQWAIIDVEADVPVRVYVEATGTATATGIVNILYNETAL